ncbi:chemotaxis protein CheA [Alteriqipengyuania lutimaris]|uniref:Chemotaxis protein CheA n=1 Tax=Alteriqipengyuania lutimaris TaxID=1538146 RepID=A0A395LMU8_9SPHN|nr:chemotaxis protein CheA [Alteriqipengyuania lutimaris]MBB3032503.1 two-component system chemotaxis sensor kinase CheA [Alteriqipengyuania lutimaris]RDS78363.1 chemotaxis protein CheA [Alteriqipengyuania lutimaris]
MSDDLDDIQAIFFEECNEGLAVAEAGLSTMADGDTSADVIAGVFRAVHSIKGGAGAFGHEALQSFSHIFENLLDEVRAGRIEPNAHICKNMLLAFDVLSDHVQAAQGFVAVPDDAAMLATLEALLAEGSGDAPAEDAAAAPEASAPAAEGEADEFGFMPVVVDIEDLDQEPDAFMDLGDGDAQDSAADAGWSIRFAPSRDAMANGSEPLLVLRELERMGGEVVGVETAPLPPLRELDPEAAYFTWFVSAPATVTRSDIEEAFDFVAPDSGIDIVEGVAPSTKESEPEQQPEPEAKEGSAASDAAPSAPPVENTPPAAAAKAAPPAPPAEAKAIEPPQNIRVDVSKLDMLLNLVGELVIRNSILADRLSSADQQRVELPELARLTREIQDNVMSLRAQPIRQAFSRVPRMLRELCSATNKDVVLEVSGEATEVDKSVIEKIGEPLTHMIRNAVDHGIESTEERVAKGKSAQGNLQLSAEQKGARIFLRVADDGRGIDRERVLAKAVEKGIVAPDATLSDEEIDNLICAPGFSTAETISSISGRGVGMDVVRSNVEALGGRIEITSVPGKGTTFTMILPLTLAILDGMVVRLCGQRYVLPLSNVVETVQPEPGQMRPVANSSEVIDMRGTYVPVKRLSELFQLPPADREDEDSVVIIVETDAGNVGLMVDTIEDRREVVIKSLDQNLYPIRGLGGATILGDGSIALILDIEALVASANSPSKFVLKGMAA